LENPPADFFTRELDTTLLQQKADLAIHSAKDLPYPLPVGLEVIALLEATDQTDSLVSKNNQTLAQLPAGSVVGTSSPVRKKELQALRPDLVVAPVRGTIEARIQQVDTGTLDALIVATCALQRLGLESSIAEVLPFQTHPLQGNLAIVAQSGRSDLKALFAEKDIRHSYGPVTLAGFGPGDPGLFTLSGEKALREADIVFYDDLLDANFLEVYPAEKVYVGKRKNRHHMEQSAINRLLLDAARKGKNVLRLKGGDPMIFAHGGEEMEYLRQHFVPVTVIPGISAGIAAAALSQIPLTHRGIASSVTFMTGHSDQIDFPNTDTVVIYMGAANLKSLAIHAIAQGRKPSTPVLISSNISRPAQEYLFSTLESLAQTERTLPTPLLVIIGNVAGLRDQAAETLRKTTILVTGTDAESSRKQGQITHQPLIHLESVAQTATLNRILRRLNQFDWIFFTSRHSVDFFFQFLNKLGKDSRSLGKVKVASVGQSTTNKLLQYGIIPELQAGRESSEGLLKDLDIKDVPIGKVLLPRSSLGLPILPNGLEERGWTVTKLVLYTNQYPEGLKPLDWESFDLIDFSSPSCVTNFQRLYGKLPAENQVILKGLETEKRYLELQQINQLNKPYES